MGAGPAGACLALLLCRHGVAVTLVEANPHQGRPFRGEALMPSGLAALDQMGLLPLIAAIPHRELSGWRFVLNRRELFTATEPLGPLDGRPCTLVNQEALIDGVIAMAAATGHLTLVANTHATTLSRNPQGRSTGVQLSNGRSLDADLVVACDGRYSRLRQQAQIALLESSSAIDVLWFQLPCPGGNPLGGKFTTLVGGSGIVSLFESASGAVQLGWVLGHDEPTPQRSSQAWIAAFASQSPPELAAWLHHHTSELASPKRLSVQVGLAERWGQPGFLLLGDAAHPMSPVRAQGINMALRDAWVASEELLPALLPALLEPSKLDQAIARIEARRRPEIIALQALQAQEAQRGNLLSSQGLLRCGLAISAPILGAAIGQHWVQQQKTLRQGLTSLEAAA